MAARNVILTDHQDEFVDTLVRSGRYADASEAIRDAVRTLEQRMQQEEARLHALREAVDVGLDALDAGDFVDVKEEDLDAYLTSLR